MRQVGKKMRAVLRDAHFELGVGATQQTGVIQIVSELDLFLALSELIESDLEELMRPVKVHPMFVGNPPGFDKQEQYVRMRIEAVVKYPTKRAVEMPRNFLYSDLLEVTK